MDKLKEYWKVLEVYGDEVRMYRADEVDKQIAELLEEITHKDNQIQYLEEKIYDLEHEMNALQRSE